MKKNYSSSQWRYIFIAVVCLLANNIGRSQNIPINEPDNNLPRYFDAARDTLGVAITNLSSIFLKKPGEEIIISTNTDFVFRGKLQSAESKYNGQLESAVVKLENFENVLLVFSKAIPITGIPYYRALIIGKSAGDYLQLKQINNQFVLIKDNINRLRAE